MTSLSFDTPIHFDLGTVNDVATGDFDGDGNLDIVTAGYDPDTFYFEGKVSILLGDGDGNFKPENDFFIGSENIVNRVLVGDFNGDGNTDLVTNSNTRTEANLFLGDGAGDFSLVSNIDDVSNSSIAVDINGDGFDDIITNGEDSYDGSRQVKVLLANTEGGFDPPKQFQSENYSLDIVSGDFNGDGNIDIATSSYDNSSGNNTTVFVRLGDGTGNLSEPTEFNTSGDNTQSLTASDFNGDGVLDLAAFDYVYNNSTLSILLGDDTGNFGPATAIDSPNGVSLESGDLNRDGNIDLVLTSSDYDSGVSIFLGDGVGGFRFERIETDFPNYAVALGDFNGDAALDILTANGFGLGATVILGALGQKLVGTNGQDILAGENGPDTLEGLGGNDILEGNQGDDQIFGGSGNDDIIGGDGNDTISGGSGSDIITGSDNNDRITGNKGNDNLAGDNGDDTLNGGAGNDRLRGGIGADRLLGGTDNDTILGGQGEDTLLGQGGNDILVGGSGNDSLNGSGGDDSLRGESGSDILRGGAGQDTLDGGTGNDNLSGGGASDSLLGRAGDDILKGDSGADTLKGGNGDDTLFGGKGNDVLDGEDGIDTVDFGNSQQAITLLSQGVINAGSDGLDEIQNIEVVIGAVGKANAIDGTVQGESTASLDVNLGLNQLIVNNIPGLGSASFTVENFLNVTGTSNQDQITGSNRDNELLGAEGNDVFGVSEGNDIVDGGAGNDRIDYSNLATAIALSSTGLIEKGTQGVDTLRSIEVVIGASGQTNTIDATLNADPGINVDVDLADNSFTVFDSPSGDPLFFEVENFVNVTGSQNNDTLAGNNRSNVLTGGAGSDSLNGRGGSDILTGVDSASATAGQNELDTLTGGTGADTYVLGDSDTVFYSFSGEDDFALINGFQSGRDLIQLSGVLTDYVFSGTTSNTAIFQDGNNNGIVDAGDDLIAQLSSSGFATSDLTFV